MLTQRNCRNYFAFVLLCDSHWSLTHTASTSSSRLQWKVMSAPNSKQRQACWGARDELWKCLDLTQDNTAACEKYRKEYEASCPAQWVKYFNKRRGFLKYKEKMEKEGFEPAEGARKL
ncbi:hypothetical protein KOW79_015975 [Hemibagrus wyckioides]|uniref:Cytochrome c oxidase assembly factor 6 homolog n=2 Tax=Hemibagrus wyckioides TaxID=337641 RepID=A0A9D3SDH4_9TELE|nr:hypothetical protein KOW79_015975 [Hemibagrus wyckioides]